MEFNLLEMFRLRKIGNNCIIGAGALVTENTVIPDGMMAFGSPAKVKRALTEDEIKGIKHTADHYVEQTEKSRHGK